MRKKLILVAVLMGFLASCATPLMPGQDKQPAKEQVPQHGIWKLEMDDKLDGMLDPNTASTHEFRISVINNRLIGTNTHPDWVKVGIMTGEITTGDMPIIFIRQDGTGRKGEVRYYCGKQVKDGVFEGTFYQSLGGAGDFRLTLQKED